MTPSPREDRCPPPRPPGRRRPAPPRRAPCCAPRPEAVEAGCAKVMGFDTEAIWEEMEARTSAGRPSQEHPFGTGDAAVKIVDIIERFIRQPSK